MLLELSIKNFRSIKDWQVISMLAEKKVKENPASVISRKNHKILSTSIIYGRNASGKSNLLRAFSAIQYMVLESARFKLNESINPFEPYKLDAEYAGKPVEFKIDFIAKNGIRYIYEIGYGAMEIEYERLKFFPKSQSAVLFDRQIGGKIKYGEYMVGEKKRIENSLYANQLFLSKIGTEKLDVLIYPYDFFSEYLFISIIHDTNYDNSLVQFISEKMGKGEIPAYNENMSQLMRVADTGIQSLSVKEIDMDFESFPEDMDSETKREIIERYKYRIRTKHKAYEKGEEAGEVEFSLQEESTGTIKLLIIGGLVLDALEDGSVLIIDELDKSLHPLLTRELIKLFQDPDKNPHGAQLIFATHDTSLLDNKLFRRDEIWIVEKESEGNSTCYSLSDISGVRSTTPFEKWYLSGRFGGTPVINDDDLSFHY